MFVHVVTSIKMKWMLRGTHQWPHQSVGPIDTCEKLIGYLEGNGGVTRVFRGLSS